MCCSLLTTLYFYLLWEFGNQHYFLKVVSPLFLVTYLLQLYKEKWREFSNKYLIRCSALQRKWPTPPEFVRFVKLQLAGNTGALFDEMLVKTVTQTVRQSDIFILLDQKRRCCVFLSWFNFHNLMNIVSVQISQKDRFQTQMKLQTLLFYCSY